MSACSDRAVAEPAGSPRHDGDELAATSSTFWANTNGATQGVIFQSIAVPGAAITDKSLAFSDAFKKRFGSDPSYAATWPTIRSTTRRMR